MLKSMMISSLKKILAQKMSVDYDRRANERRFATTTKLPVA
jgi:hypothetical protein